MLRRHHTIITSLILLYSFISCLTAVHASSPKREMRGVWLATVWGIDWPSVTGTSAKVRQRQQSDMLAILDRCESMNLTSVFFQVRGMGDVMYESSVEPWSGFVSGKRGSSPGWDPLRFVVEECHRRGLECYAWVNPFRWSSGTNYDSAPDRKWKERGWLLTYGKYTVFNPGLEEVREHIVDVCREIVTGYDVDGLVFDDYFYPNRIPETSDAPDYDLWQQQAPWMSFGDWRRANVHKTVADVHCMISDTRPDVRFGISPAGVAGKKHTSAVKWGMLSCDVKADDWQYKEIYSDPLGWLYQRTVDFISPQIYWSTTHSTAPYEPIARWWSNAAGIYGCHFYSSMTLAPLEKNDTHTQRQEIIRQLKTNRAISITGEYGSVLYSAKFLPKLAAELPGGYFMHKSLTPAIRHGEVEPPMPPINLRIKGSVLSWENSEDSNNTGTRYAVYAYPSELDQETIMDDSGDGVDGEYLYKVCYGNSIAVPAGMSYAVTTLTGTSIESDPVFVK
ncbi:MAG: family 10 glycosylhydrolase [Bacteroides sp.]|nr:family 10 glycosylhydrolase [Bacteroides sp.]